MTSTDLLIIGGIMLDHSVVSNNIPSAGETLRGQSFYTAPGGKGANIAVACARLSHPKPSHFAYMENIEPTYLQQGYTSHNITIKMIGAVGKDQFGSQVLDCLRQNGVESTNIMLKEGHMTGVTIILLQPSGENRIIAVPGATSAVKPEDIPVLPTPLPKYLIMGLETPIATLIHVSKLAKQACVPVIFNPSPIPDKPLPSELYSSITDLIMNESEAEILSRAREKGLSIRGNLLETARIFLACGISIVIITLGEEGYFYATEDGKQYGQETALPTKAIDVTGAGDTVVGAYAIARSRGAGIAEAISWANKCASKTVEKRGAMDAIPWLDEVPSAPFLY